MCKDCIVLGAMFNAVESDSFPCCFLSQFDFKYSETNRQLLDKTSAEYLKDTLGLFKKAGVELMPIKVDSDGSCLPHAVSRGLVGQEIYYDMLRASMTNELRTHSGWYRTHTYLQLLDDEEFDKQMKGLIRMATPTRGSIVGEEKHLEGIHILALANALMRPILLLDTLTKMQEAKSDLNLDGCGMYLPLRHSREEIQAAIGRVAPPLVIGWSNCAYNHYTAFWCKSTDQNDISATYNQLMGGGSSNENNTIQFLLQFNEQLQFAASEVLKKDASVIQSVSNQLLAHVASFASLPPLYRTSSAQVLTTILNNVNVHLEAVIRMQQQPNDVGELESAKYLRIKEEKKLFKFAVFRVPGALSLLEDAGFVLKKPEASSADSDYKLAEYEFVVKQNFTVQQQKINKLILGLLSLFIPGGSCVHLVHPLLPAAIEHPSTTGTAVSDNNSNSNCSSSSSSMQSSNNGSRRIGRTAAPVSIQELFGSAPIIGDCLRKRKQEKEKKGGNSGKAGAATVSEVPEGSECAGGAGRESGQDYDLWEIAVREYGESGELDVAGTTWLFGTGSLPTASSLTDRRQRAIASFKSLAVDSPWGKEFLEYWTQFGGNDASSWLRMLQTGQSAAGDECVMQVYKNAIAATTLKCAVCEEFIQFHKGLALEGMSAIDMYFRTGMHLEQSDLCPNCKGTTMESVPLFMTDVFLLRMQRWLVELFESPSEGEARKEGAKEVTVNKDGGGEGQREEQGETQGEGAKAMEGRGEAAIAIRHPNIWVCQSIDPKMKRKCKVANDARCRTACYQCRKSRTDLSVEQLAEIERRIAAKAAAANLPPTGNTSQRDNLNTSHTGSMLNSLMDGMMNTGNNSLWRTAPASGSRNAQYSVDDHESLLARAMEILTSESLAVAAKSSFFVIQRLQGLVELYSSSIEAVHQVNSDISISNGVAKQLLESKRERQMSILQGAYSTIDNLLKGISNDIEARGATGQQQDRQLEQQLEQQPMAKVHVGASADNTVPTTSPSNGKTFYTIDQHAELMEDVGEVLDNADYKTLLTPAQRKGFENAVEQFMQQMSVAEELSEELEAIQLTAAHAHSKSQFPGLEPSEEEMRLHAQLEEMAETHPALSVEQHNLVRHEVDKVNDLMADARRRQWSQLLSSDNGRVHAANGNGNANRLNGNSNHNSTLQENISQQQGFGSGSSNMSFRPPNGGSTLSRQQAAASTNLNHLFNGNANNLMNPTVSSLLTGNWFGDMDDDDDRPNPGPAGPALMNNVVRTASGGHMEPWQCAHCTMTNFKNRNVCEVCEIPRAVKAGEYTGGDVVDAEATALVAGGNGNV